MGLESADIDTVVLHAASTVEGDAILELGDGNDVVELHGEIEGNTEVHGDAGDDTATIGVTGDLDGTLLLAMGDGTNSFTSHGEIGPVYYFGGEANDSIVLAATSEVQTDARLSVGAGDNSISVIGSVDGTLTIVSANAEEEVIIDENATVGTTTMLLSVEDDHGHDHGEDGHTHDDPNADFDNSGTVDFSDFLTLANVFGQTVTDDIAHIDIDGSGTIDFGDFLILADQFDGSETSETTGIDIDHFVEGALAEEPSLVECTLSDGTETMCYEITVVGEPVDQEVGPFCPLTTSATAEEGGIWFDGENLYDIDGDFILRLAEIYDDPNWMLYNEDGTVNVTDTLEAFEGAARPNVAEEYQNHCVEGRLEWLEDGHYITTTVLIPVEPVPVETPVNPGSWGVTLNGVNIAASAPVNAILGAYTIAAFDDNGGHFNPVDGYHLHGVVEGSGSSIFEDHENMIGYALDGHAIFAPLEEGDPDLAELDQCGGHFTEGIGYHYHANPAEANSVLSCLTGAVVGNVGGGGPGGGGPGGGGPGGGGDVPPVDPVTDPDGALPASAYTGDYTLADEEFGTMVTVTVEGDTRTIVSNALPDHEIGVFPNPGNPNTPTEQNINVQYPAEGTFIGTPTTAIIPGIAVNGVQFVPGTGESVTCGSGETYRIEPFQDLFAFGLDFNNAHVQPTGNYHYHGISELLVNAYTTDDDLVHVGFAADGFLMYYSKSGVYTSSYQLSTEPRVGTDCARGGPQGGPFEIEGTMPDGTFLNDWVYVEGSGDLDQCNGITVGDQYAYMVTDNWPNVSRCLMGEVAGGGPGGGGGGGGGGRPPGGGGGPVGGGGGGGAPAAALVDIAEDDEDQAFAELDPSADFLDMVADELVVALSTS